MSLSLSLSPSIYIYIYIYNIYIYMEREIERERDVGTIESVAVGGGLEERRGGAARQGGQGERPHARTPVGRCVCVCMYVYIYIL